MKNKKIPDILYKTIQNIRIYIVKLLREKSEGFYLVNFTDRYCTDFSFLVFRKKRGHISGKTCPRLRSNVRTFKLECAYA